MKTVLRWPYHILCLTQTHHYKWKETTFLYFAVCYWYDIKGNNDYVWIKLNITNQTVSFLSCGFICSSFDDIPSHLAMEQSGEMWKIWPFITVYILRVSGGCAPWGHQKSLDIDSWFLHLSYFAHLQCLSSYGYRLVSFYW